MTENTVAQNDLVSGRIFDIQRYSVHDGPGIRTIVFLKGCVLRCRWCCNPESQEYGIQQMTLGGKTKTVGEDVTVGQVMETVEKDRAYYDRSGGGMTLSGGESLCQPDFAVALLRAAHFRGISTAIETTACVPQETVRLVIPHVDHVLMDIKHMDGEKHRAFTGRSNELILSNASVVASLAAHMVVRVPVIPGFNDTAAEIGDIARFAATLPGVKEIHLLPYHRLGQDKYAGLGRSYALYGIEPLRPENMEHLLSAARQHGLWAQIGG